MVGDSYLRGTGVEASVPEARRGRRRGGKAKAAVDVDRAQAAELFERAAAQGNVDAQFRY